MSTHDRLSDGRGESTAAARPWNAAMSILLLYRLVRERQRVAKVAKLFINGGSQAVRLPAEFRFNGREVYVRRDPLTGDVVLSSRPDTWAGFFALRDAVAPPP